MNTYKVTWITSTGGEIEKEFECEQMQYLPNGAVIFVVTAQVAGIHLVTPSSPEQPPAEVIGTVAGFNSIEKVS